MMAARYDKTTNGFLFSLEKEKLSCKTCAACGDPTGSMEDRMKSLRDEDRWPHRDEWLYCRECADEKFRRRLSITPARTFPSGGGCPLEWSGSTDAGPWGENAIRHLEDN
jgi:ribosomal protein L34E